MTAKPRSQGATVQAADGGPVPFHQVVPGEVHDGVDGDLGDVREKVAHPHEREPPGHVRRRDPQDVALLEDAQLLDLGLQVVGRGLGQAAPDVGCERIAVGRAVEGARVEQLVEEHRVLREKRGDPGAGVGELHQAPQCGRVFQEQREVAGAPLHGPDEVQDAPAGR